MFLKCHKLFEQYCHILAYGVCFALPLKLSIAYVFLIPLVLLFIGDLIFHKLSSPQTPGYQSPQYLKSNCFAAIATFVIVAFIQSSFGIDVWRSYSKLLSLSFTIILIPLTIKLIIEERIKLPLLLGLLVAGQSIAALHTVIEALHPTWSFKPFVGAVSESGQLGLIIFAAMGLLNYKSIKAQSSFIENRYLKFLLFIAITLLFTALLINLKRGPWFGVSAGLLIFLWLNKRWLLIPTIISGLAIFIFVQPIRTRLAQADEHFHIAGGRGVIWDIGIDLALRNPLGLGYQNSAELRKYSDEIPEELKHFHSNILNVLVETGYFGLAIYLWWVWALLSSCFNYKASQYAPLMQALGCGFVSWQLAGLVEYNFGDSEVVLIAFILAGVAGGLKHLTTQPKEEALKSL